MSRPREYDQRTSTKIRFAPDLLERLRQEAGRRDVSVNLLVNKAVAHYLDRLTPMDALGPRLFMPATMEDNQ